VRRERRRSTFTFSTTSKYHFPFTSGRLYFQFYPSSSLVSFVLVSNYRENNISMCLYATNIFNLLSIEEREKADMTKAKWLFICTAACQILSSKLKISWHLFLATRNNKQKSEHIYIHSLSIYKSRRQKSHGNSNSLSTFRKKKKKPKIKREREEEKKRKEKKRKEKKRKKEQEKKRRKRTRNNVEKGEGRKTTKCARQEQQKKQT
jgi:hypothetical protein